MIGRIRGFSEFGRNSAHHDSNGLEVISCSKVIGRNAFSVCWKGQMNLRHRSGSESHEHQIDVSVGSIRGGLMKRTILSVAVLVACASQASAGLSASVPS